MNDRTRTGGAPADLRATAGRRKRVIDYGVLPNLVGYRLRRAMARVFDDFMTTVAADGVTPGLFGVLVLIDANSGLSQSELAKALGIERSTVVAIIDRLQAAGWVRRDVAERDRRSYALTLTPEGQALLARFVPKVQEHERRIVDGLGEDEVRTLVGILARIAVPPKP